MEASRALDEAIQDQAFEFFYRRYAKHVYRYTLAVLRNPADAEDVTQTTFLNAYRAMRQGERPRKPHNWLIKIAHNACRSRYLRLARRPKEVPLDEAIEQLAVPPEDRPSVKALLAALGALPFNQRAALVMRELEGRSYAEIADTLDVSIPAVEMLIFRARKAMRMRAGSLRSLGAVQLPASLASWLEGGGVIAGGTAAVGTGIAVKAALALTAAAVMAGGVKATVLEGSTGRTSDRVVVVSTPVLRAGAHAAQRLQSLAQQSPAVEASGWPTRHGDFPRSQLGGAEDPAAAVAEPVHPSATASSGPKTSAPNPAAPSPAETVAQTVPAVPTPSAPSVSAPSPPSVSAPSPPSVSTPPVGLPVALPDVPSLPLPPPPLPPLPELP